jgi:hypothetical protein
VQRWPPILRALLAQAAAFGLLLLLTRIPLLANHLGPWGWTILDAVLAVVLTGVLMLPWWWLPIAGLFPILLVTAAGTAVPGWIWGVALGLLLALFGGGVASRVPLYLSGRRVSAALVDLLPRRAGARAIDLGCGLAGPVLVLAKARPDAEVSGIEASPLSWLVARLRCLGRRNARIAFGSIWSADLSDQDLVFAFLSPAPMPRLWEKARAELKPGAFLVSRAFAIPGIEPKRVITLGSGPNDVLYLYEAPRRAG